MGIVSLNVLGSRRPQERWADPARWSLASDLTRHLSCQLGGGKRFLEDFYVDHIEATAVRQYINTEGSLWTGRVGVAHAELQRARLGRLAIVRNPIYPGHAVSWRGRRA